MPESVDVEMREGLRKWLQTGVSSLGSANWTDSLGKEPWPHEAMIPVWGHLCLHPLNRLLGKDWPAPWWYINRVSVLSPAEGSTSEHLALMLPDAHLGPA